MESSETIVIKKESLWKYSTFILAAILIIGIFVFVLKNSPKESGNVVSNDGQQAAGQTARVEVSEDDDVVIGEKDAPVTIIEFSDYECPFCGRHFEQTHPQLVKDYINTGKVRLVFRDFPLSFHPNAQKSAEAAECVRYVSKSDEAYWKMHDKIFENQKILSIDKLSVWARELGYDIDSCLDSDKFADEVKKDLADGSAAGVGGTPSFFINGKMLEGAQPYSSFKQLIDSELS